MLQRYKNINEVSLIKLKSVFVFLLFFTTFCWLFLSFLSDFLRAFSLPFDFCSTRYLFIMSLAVEKALTLRYSEINFSNRFSRFSLSITKLHFVNMLLKAPFMSIFLISLLSKFPCLDSSKMSPDYFYSKAFFHDFEY